MPQSHFCNTVYQNNGNEQGIDRYKPVFSNAYQQRMCTSSAEAKTQKTAKSVHVAVNT